MKKVKQVTPLWVLINEASPKTQSLYAYTIGLTIDSKYYVYITPGSCTMNLPPPLLYRQDKAKEYLINHKMEYCNKYDITTQRGTTPSGLHFSFIKDEITQLLEGKISFEYLIKNNKP